MPDHEVALISALGAILVVFALLSGALTGTLLNGDAAAAMPTDRTCLTLCSAGPVTGSGGNVPALALAGSGSGGNVPAVR